MSIFSKYSKRKNVGDLRTFHVPFIGGLDTDTPKWDIEDGSVRSSKNYEIGINNGYIDIEGYERFDGRPSPSDALYAIIDVNITGSFSIGQLVEQLVSLATGRIIAIVTTETPNYIVVTKITGAFNAVNALQVAAVTQATPLSLARIGGAATPLLNAQYLALAAENYRVDILSVGGAGASGSILGITMLDNVKYAFRNNSGGTAVDIYKSTTSGWTMVPLKNEISFTVGNRALGEPDAGATITVGANTAVIRRVLTTSGSWTAGTAAGKMVIDNAAPAALAAGAGTLSGGTCTVGTGQTAIVIQPSGRYEFDLGQFGGAANATRAYGCDGVNKGFEFDGVTYVPLATGMPSDNPTHVAIHSNHLFFSFGASAQHSSIGYPYSFSPITGADEIATGDMITGFMQESGAQGAATLVIFNRNNTHVLYGSSVSDWSLVRYKRELGAYAHTIQQIGVTVFQDDRGITDMRTAQEFGNFQHATLTRRIQKLFDTKKNLATSSCVSRSKNQYRIFYTDKTALYITLSDKGMKGVMPIELSHKATAMFSLENNNGDEEMFFGSDDGFVYQMDRGVSFDGGVIEAYIELHYTHLKMLRRKKRFKGIAMEVEGTGYAAFNFTYSLGYGSTDIEQAGIDSNDLGFAAVNWDSFEWDAFVWDGQTLKPTTNKLTGSAENISLIISKSSNYYFPAKISGALIRYKVGRLLRE